MSIDPDLERLSERLGGPVDKVVRIQQLFAPEWRPGIPLTDRDILRMATHLGKGRYPQWKSMLGQLSNPRFRPVESQVADGEIRLTPTLTTSFHQQLVTSDFVEKVKACLAAHPALSGRGASGYLIPDYNEERYMGPQSVVKYRFNIAVVSKRPDSPVRWQLSFNIEYRPKHDSFRVRFFFISFEWRLETLKNQLVEAGAVTTEQFDHAVREAESDNRVDKLLGLVSPVRCLIAQDRAVDSKIQALLVANGGFTLVPESSMKEAQLLGPDERSHTYNALLVKAEPLSYAVLSSAITTEDFEYTQWGADGGALPAFTEPGSVSKHLRRLTS